MPTELKSAMKKKEYDDILTSDSFAIVIRCKHCHSIGCFIGISSKSYSGHICETNVDIICENCGYVENCY